MQTICGAVFICGGESNSFGGSERQLRGEKGLGSKCERFSLKRLVWRRKNIQERMKRLYRGLSCLVYWFSSTVTEILQLDGLKQ